MRLRELGAVLWQPVQPEARALLARSWASLPEALRSAHQMYGRQGNACGATIGAQPRCDFACSGCYLGAQANHVAPEPVQAIQAQMRALRPLLGPNGNLQLTDGEITLRPEAELIELLRYADTLGLVPMLMTHGDSFRRRPGLLERLMEQGGLREISVHVDTTMRGRWGAAYKHARDEAALEPLREEFADLIRVARRRTGLPLVAATTMTVTRDNLAGVKHALRGTLGRADAFKMISFQPAAQVGRTRDGLGGQVSVEELWTQIAAGLEGPAHDLDFLRRGEMWLGHPACNRYVHGFVLFADGQTPRFHPLRLAGDARDERAVEGYLRRFGGTSFRRDTPGARRARALALLARAPGFWLGQALPWFWHKLRAMDARTTRLAWRLVRGQARLEAFNIVSHHFMSRAELDSELGQARLAACVFKVPIDGVARSMCEVNAAGLREAYYAKLGPRRKARARAVRADA
jgi:hypothetical protein